MNEKAIIYIFDCGWLMQQFLHQGKHYVLVMHLERLVIPKQPFGKAFCAPSLPAYKQ